MSDTPEYRKAEPGETRCGDCIHTRKRPGSGRLECTSTFNGFAVGRKNTCGRGQAGKNAGEEAPNCDKRSF